MPPSSLPSMPSQSLSVNVPSGSSLVDGGWQSPHPAAPRQVRVPLHLPKGVSMSQGFLAPALTALQSQAPLAGRHCLNTVPCTVTSVQTYPCGHSIVEQSRAQKLPPVGAVRQRSRATVEHSSLWLHAVQGRWLALTQTFATCPGSITPRTP